MYCDNKVSSIPSNGASSMHDTKSVGQFPADQLLRILAIPHQNCTWSSPILLPS